MGSTCHPDPELTAALAALEEDEQERNEEAIRSVRERLTTRFKAEDDRGVLETLRPREIARVLAGEIDDGLHLFELARARGHFMELGRKLRPFYNAFVAERLKAKRGTKRYVPDEETLRARFGDDWALVRDAWPAVAFLVKVLELREYTLMPPEEKAAREEAYWIEAEVFLTLLHPNQPVKPDVQAFVERVISAMSKKRDELLVYETLNYVFDDVDGLQKRLLAYSPGGEEARALERYVGAFKNAARDLRAKIAGPATLGTTGGQEIKRSAGTLRRWKHEERRRAQPGTPPSRKSLVDIADEKEARRQHRDPTGEFLTLTQVAENLRVPESSVRNAVKRAREAGELAPRRLLGSTSYAFRPGHDERIIERFLGRRRAPKGGRTIEAAAREAGVPLEQAISLILAIEEELGWEAERAISAGKVIPRDQYEALVQMLRDGCDVAAAGGSAKPRTS